MSTPQLNDAVANTAAILSGYCGRDAATGTFQACGHDHTGDATALVNMVVQYQGPQLLEEVLASSKANSISRSAIQLRIDELKARRDTVPAR